MKKQSLSLKHLFYNFILLITGLAFVSLSGCKKPKNDDNGGGDNIQPMYGVKVSAYKHIEPQIKQYNPLIPQLQVENKI